jgi:hypothetical protein
MALNILTNGYSESADFNMKLWVDNTDHDGMLVNMTEAEVREGFRTWSIEHDRM